MLVSQAKIKIQKIALSKSVKTKNIIQLIINI